MTGGASAGSSGLRGIVVLCMDPNGPRIGKLFVFAMTGKAKVVIVVCFGQLGWTGPSMGIMTVKTKDPGIKMAALLKVEPLLMMGFRMGLWISPASGPKLVIVGEGLSYFVRFIVFVIPGVFKRSIRNAHPSRMTLTAHLEASFVGQFSGMDDLSLGLGSFDMFRARAMASFATIIKLDIFGPIPSVSLLQLEAGIMAACTAHFKRFFNRGLFETSFLTIPTLQVIGNPSGGRLVPLKWKKIVVISHLDLIELSPAPSP
jgi:hypothetical protein